MGREQGQWVQGAGTHDCSTAASVEWRHGGAASLSSAAAVIGAEKQHRQWLPGGAVVVSAASSGSGQRHQGRGGAREVLARCGRRWWLPQGGITFLPPTKAYTKGTADRRDFQRARRAPGTDLAIPRTGLHRGRTQHMPLSAPDVKTMCKRCQRGTKRVPPPMECAPIHHRRTVEVDWM